MRVKDKKKYSEKNRVWRRKKIVRRRVYEKKEEKKVFNEVKDREVRIVDENEEENS